MGCLVVNKVDTNITKRQSLTFRLKAESRKFLFKSYALWAREIAEIAEILSTQMDSLLRDQHFVLLSLNRIVSDCKQASISHTPIH